MDTFAFNSTVSEEQDGQRLDLVISQLLPEHSRSRIQGWIRAGGVTVNDKRLKQRDTVYSGDHIKIHVEFEPVTDTLAEPIPLDIIYEDDAIILINKPAGLVVHPGAGNPSQTLVNGLLHHDPQLQQLPRAGIVHRLDKDTTGILLVAKTPQAHTALVEKLQAREIKREYQALVCGQITAGGKVDTPIGRHPAQRTRMAVTRSGKAALTHYRLLEKFPHYTLLRVQLETGRTHQIRVHMSHIKHPIVGDPVYGQHQSLVKGISAPVREAVMNFKRQALHAWQLSLPHPQTGETVSYQASLPDDMQTLINVLQTHDRG